MNTTDFSLAKKITISGIVQGVGFRPFVYKKAKQYGLFGEVSNSISGVVIILEGSKDSINAFLDDINDEAPPISRIDKIFLQVVPKVGFSKFSIVKSKLILGKPTIGSSDISVCYDCINDINDPKNRRYKYPFTNCTNCGPRYTITLDIPYDRKKTSMNSFKMCSLCQAEYDDPDNRRFHAQPNACSTCGPTLYLTDSKGNRIQSKDVIISVSELIKKGFIIAIKGLGGFHLTVDATNDLAISRLRFKKKRKDKPFALMSANINSIRTYAVVSASEAELLSNFQKPIVLLEKLNTSLISDLVSPNNGYLGVMLPYTPLHHLILANDFYALVMTSGNLSGEAICTDNKKALKNIGGIADYFLFNDRDIIIGADDSILRFYSGESRMIRRSRGYVPYPVRLLKNQPSILACGAEAKNTICITRGKNAFISQHIGNLGSKDSYKFFRKTINHMERILKVIPEIVACDYHPNYTSTRYAIDFYDRKVVKVQHHHAHIVSCMVENNFDQPVIGLAFDGTGMGIDGTIWGGEVLIANYSFFERVAFLEPVPMPGSLMAVREPWRMAISYLYRVFGEAFWSLDLPILKSINKDDIQTLITMICGKINSPYTSSLGRFFDGISALVGVRNKVTFEGQSAIEFEAIAARNIRTQYDLEINNRTPLSLITAPIVKGVVDDVLNGVMPSVISAKFHNTIVSMFLQVSILLRKSYGIKCVALSGGVFQNLLLMRKIKNNLEKNNFKVITHRLVPCNDGGISLGQAVVASHLI